MLTYKKRDTFLQRLHPIPGILLIVLYIAAFLTIDNPLYLMGVFLSLLLLSYFDGCLNEILKYGEIIFPFAFLIMILNPLIVKNGSTVIYSGHFNIPVLGRVRITLEAVLYGIVIGLRMVFVVMVCGFFNMVINPDRAFTFFSKFMKKSALLMSMTIRLFPQIMKSYRSVVEAEKLRGGEILNKGIKNKVKNYGNIVNILFISSLEDSGDMAESMYSRGYGIGKRSTYFNEKMSFWDFVYIFVCIGIFVYMEIIKSKGLNTMNYYPKCDNPFKTANTYGYVMVLLFFIPAFINWGFKKWKY